MTAVTICSESESESRSVVSHSLWPHIVHGVFLVRILEWVFIPFSRGSSQPRDRTQVSAMQVNSLPSEPQGKPKNTGLGSLPLIQHIFLTQELNQGLLHCRQILYQLSYLGSCDFGAQEDKVFHYFHYFPIYLTWSDDGCHDLSFLQVEI